MKKIFNIAKWAAIVIALWLLIWFLFSPHVIAIVATPTASAATTSTVAIPPSSYDHKLETWLSALEWCESRGDPTAVNWKDRDGTPSYFSYQFKPSTFAYYGKLYGLINPSSTPEQVFSLMHDYNLTRSMVKRMTQDPGVDFSQQFPDCVLHHIGYPPTQ